MMKVCQGVSTKLNSLNIPDEDLKAAQQRIDAASPETFQLALDAMYDMALQYALVKRSMRELDGKQQTRSVS